MSWGQPCNISQSFLFRWLTNMQYFTASMFHLFSSLLQRKLIWVNWINLSDTLKPLVYGHVRADKFKSITDYFLPASGMGFAQIINSWAFSTNFLFLPKNGCYQTGNKYRPTFVGIVLQILMYQRSFKISRELCPFCMCWQDNYKMHMYLIHPFPILVHVSICE